MIECIRATRCRFPRQIPQVDLLLVDDILFLSKKEARRGILPHLQRAFDNRKQIIITSDRRPRTSPIWKTGW
jgi:chromosomal replication initiation ATPase DnaA